MTIAFIKGADSLLVSRAVSQTVGELVAGDDPTLMLEELTENDFRRDDDTFAIARLVDAAQTPPFLTDRRVVVARHLSRFSKAADVAPLILYLESQLESTHLVLVWESGVDPKPNKLPAVPKTLSEALGKAGAKIIDCSVPTGKNAAVWLDRELKQSALRIDARAGRLIADHLAEQRPRVVALLNTLEGVYGAAAAIGVEEVTPFLGDAGEVPPWELTDAIDSSKIDVALEKLHRMVDSGARHPFQVMASLQTHYLRIARLDGAPVAGEKQAAQLLKQAAQLLGMKGSTYPAKKALAASKRLGPDGVKRVVNLLADADRGLRGEAGWPPELVLEVLVARLAAIR